jgi:hypothetical protein
MNADTSLGSDKVDRDMKNTAHPVSVMDVYIHAPMPWSLSTWIPFFMTKSISMEESPSWEANSRSGNQYSPRLLWNLKVHFRVH